MKFVFALWTIWLASNALIFSNAEQTTHQIVFQFFHLLNEFFYLMGPSHTKMWNLDKVAPAHPAIC